MNEKSMTLGDAMKATYRKTIPHEKGRQIIADAIRKQLQEECDDGRDRKGRDHRDRNRERGTAKSRPDKGSNRRDNST